MPVYVIVDRVTGKRYREGTDLRELRVSDPVEQEEIKAGTLDPKNAKGRLLDDNEELITLHDEHDVPDEKSRTWDAQTRTRIDTPPAVDEKPVVDPETEIVLAFRGVFTPEQLRMIRQMVAVVAPDAIEE